jgi:hypothetical protein
MKGESEMKNLFNFAKQEHMAIDIEQIKDITYQTKLHSKDPFCLRDGQGYRACLTIFDLPLKVPLQWLSVFTGDDSYTTIRIRPLVFDKVKKGLQKSLRENEDRMQNHRDEFVRIEARRNYQDVEHLIEGLTSSQEQVLGLTVKVYVYAKSLKLLENKIANKLQDLQRQDYEGAVFPNEQLFEEKAKHTFKREEQFQANYEIPITSETLAAGYFFRYFDLQDPTGIYWGKNEVNANIYFDMFTNDGKHRIFYNMLILGLMGSGKTAIIGKIINQQVSAGNRVRVLDVTGENRKLVSNLGGKNLIVDGRQVAINPHMIKRIEKKETYDKHDFEAVLIGTVNNATSFLKVFAPELSQYHTSLYSQIVHYLYESKGAKTRLLTKDDEITYSDVLACIDRTIDNIKKDVAKTKELAYLQELKIILDTLTSGSYATYFNQKSTVDYYDEQLINFVVRHVTSDAKIFVPLSFLLMNMFWNELIYFGSDEKRKFEAGEVSHEEAIKYLAIFDEAHHYVSAKQEEALDIAIVYSREARKYFGGNIFASHNVKDFVPKDATKNAADKVEKLFDLMQYKIIMKQDNNAKEQLKKAFGDELRDYHIDYVNRFERGESVLNITGFLTQKMHVHLSNAEKEYLSGGN